ncbi:NAD(P)-dependent alcohol dehydrogenase [Gimesia chilikensis]|uniref:NAD(P)-dependent alcohol dehydrogenase n=1 Tax=Gimesia chilikensis TaxID=2605989 RepID=UPI0011EF53FA|nr:NAD(P)-dependent alcohol dehydrogenase [Gimesia chilikensis]KAA0139344.1 NAD(P)-dependent alcohol dehydrogenase [Gimesia chilikensis]
MQAVTYNIYGPPEVLSLTEEEVPVSDDGQVLIQVAAAGVNPVDARLRKGEMKWLMPGRFPRIPGYDVSGTVLESDDHQRLKPGDRVLAFLDHIYGGAYAEYAVCSSGCVVKIPDNLTFEEAAVLPLAGSTALQSLKDYGQLKPGDRVLINGASGGVGAFAVQIAVAYGAHVTAVASGPHEDYVRSLGACEFIDYQQESFTNADETWDLIFDVAGKRSFFQVKNVLRESGHYVTTEPGLRGISVSLITWPLSEQSHVMLARPKQEDLAELVQLWCAGDLEVRLADVYPFEEATRAHQQLEQESFCGKLVLRPAGL